MLGAEPGGSAPWVAREESEASPLVTAEGRAEELMRLVSLDVRRPFRADRRGLFTPRGQATPGVEPPAMTEGVGLDVSSCSRLMGNRQLNTIALVSQSCPTLCDPMDCSLPGSSAHGISQAGILECVDISFSSRSS